MSRSPQISIEAIPLLIKEVQKRRCLWDFKHEHYHHRYYIGLAWKNIARKLNTSVYRAKHKWKNLRDTFFRTAKRLSETREFPVKWVFYNDMLFLLPDSTDNDYDEVEDSDDSKSSLDDEKQEDETSNRNEYSNDDDSATEYDNIKSDQSCNGSQTSPAIKQTKDSDEEHDLMFLESLAQFFCKLDPMRKLTLRCRIQDMLLHEVMSQRVEGPHATFVRRRTQENYKTTTNPVNNKITYLQERKIENR